MIYFCTDNFILNIMICPMKMGTVQTIAVMSIIMGIASGLSI